METNTIKNKKHLKFISVILFTILVLLYAPIQTPAADITSSIPENASIVSAQNSNLYLNAFATAKNAAKGTNICVSNKDNSNEQLFKLQSLGSGNYLIRSQSNTSLFCVDIYTPNNVASAGSNVQLWSNTDFASKHWTFEHIGSGEYIIRSVLNKTLVLAAVSNAHRANVVAQTYTGSALQKWKLVSNGGIVIVPSASPKDWRLPWKSTKQAKFMGGYGKSASGLMGAHFEARYNSAESAYKHSLALDFSSSAANFEICAPTSGTITRVGWDTTGYGQYVVMRTSDGYEVFLAHMQQGRIMVAQGQTVNAGTVIGYMGNTGNSSGQHLHFEIRSNALPNIASGSDYTPITYLFGRTVRTWAFSNEIDWYNGGC